MYEKTALYRIIHVTLGFKVSPFLPRDPDTDLTGNTHVPTLVATSSSLDFHHQTHTKSQQLLNRRELLRKRLPLKDAQINSAIDCYSVPFVIHLYLQSLGLYLESPETGH